MKEVYCTNCGWKGLDEDVLVDENGIELCPDCQKAEIFDVDGEEPFTENWDDANWEDEEEDDDEDDWEDEED